MPRRERRRRVRQLQSMVFPESNRRCSQLAVRLVGSPRVSLPDLLRNDVCSFAFTEHVASLLLSFLRILDASIMASPVSRQRGGSEDVDTPYELNTIKEPTADGEASQSASDVPVQTSGTSPKSSKV